MELLDNIFVKHCIHTQASLMESIALSGDLARRNRHGAPLRLIIIDSIAHLFRDPGQLPFQEMYIFSHPSFVSLSCKALPLS